MELRQLRYFLTVADCRSIVNAANDLYISRQAVSKAICRLEEELGVELFVRDSGGVFLTPAGVLFYERVRGLVKELDSVAAQTKASGERYRVRIRAACAPGVLSLVEESLTNYCGQKENLDISFREYAEEECLRLLQEHQVDLMLGGSPSKNLQFISEGLVHSPIGLLIQDREALDEMDALDISDLPWLALAVPSDSQMQAFCTKHQLTIRYQGQDFYRLFSLTASGKCGLLLPQCLVPQGMPGLRWLPLAQQEKWTLYWTYPQMAETNLLFGSALEELHLCALGHLKNGKD